MKYYKNTKTGDVWAFELGGSQDYLITADMQQMTAAEIDAHINPPQTKEQVKAKIRAAFQNATAQPVTDSNGAAWSGGFDSAIKLDAAMRLAQTAGSATVTFYDDTNAPHVLTLADAQTAVLTVAADYQQKLAHKQQLFTQIDAATTQAEIDAVTW